jgi:hypothetical protein
MATGTTRVVGGYENQLRCDWRQASYWIPVPSRQG